MATSELLPAKVPLTLYRGDTRIWEDTFRTAPVAPATEGDPIDLTGYSFLCQIRATSESTKVMATIAVTILEAAAGRIRRTLTAAESKKLVVGTDGVGTGVWDLQATDPDGFVRTYMVGKVKILGDTSRDVVS
jgi:hypothetical protein